MKSDALTEMSENDFGAWILCQRKLWIWIAKNIYRVRLEKRRFAAIFWSQNRGQIFHDDGNYNDIDGIYRAKLREDLKSAGYKEEQNGWIAWKWLDDEAP